MDKSPAVFNWLWISAKIFSNEILVFLERLEIKKQWLEPTVLFNAKSLSKEFGGLVTRSVHWTIKFREPKGMAFIESTKVLLNIW